MTRPCLLRHTHHLVTSRLPPMHPSWSGLLACLIVLLPYPNILTLSGLEPNSFLSISIYLTIIIFLSTDSIHVAIATLINHQFILLSLLPILFHSVRLPSIDNPLYCYIHARLDNQHHSELGIGNGYGQHHGRLRWAKTGGRHHPRTRVSISNGPRTPQATLGRLQDILQGPQPVKRLRGVQPARWLHGCGQ